jgi:flagellar basal-body rod protein FlgB
MIEGLFSQTNYVAAKKMLDATALRHEAIARNLANVETPHYKRVDLSRSFESQLKQAIASKESRQIAAMQPELTIDPSAVSSRKDGNTVQLESEMLQLSRNTLNHSFTTQLVTGTLQRMRLAITGRPS